MHLYKVAQLLQGKNSCGTHLCNSAQKILPTELKTLINYKVTNLISPNPKKKKKNHVLHALVMSLYSTYQRYYVSRFHPDRINTAI